MLVQNGSFYDPLYSIVCIFVSANHAGPILAARTSIYLWEFLLEILEDSECASIVRWTDKAKGEFEFLNISEVARQWGIVKRRPNMDKIKMCRAMRYYYKKDIIQKVSTVKRSLSHKPCKCVINKYTFP